MEQSTFYTMPDIFGNSTQSLISLYLSVIGRNVNNHTCTFSGWILFYPDIFVLNYLRGTSEETVMIQYVCVEVKKHIFIKESVKQIIVCVVISVLHNA